MKTIALLSFLLISPCLLLPNTGLGIILGEPTGLTMKTWTTDYNAIDVALAYSFSDKEHFYLHSNYLLHKKSQIERHNIPWYWGLGGNIRYRENANDKLEFYSAIF